MKANDTILFRFTAREDDGTIIPLTGVEIVWMLARSKDSTPILVKNTLDAEIRIVDAAGGRFNVELARAETAGFAGQYYHEAKIIVWPKIWTVYSGNLEFENALAIPADLLARLATP